MWHNKFHWPRRLIRRSWMSANRMIHPELMLIKTDMTYNYKLSSINLFPLERAFVVRRAIRARIEKDHDRFPNRLLPHYTLKLFYWSQPKSHVSRYWQTKCFNEISANIIEIRLIFTEISVKSLPKIGNILTENFFNSIQFVYRDRSQNFSVYLCSVQSGKLAHTIGRPTDWWNPIIVNEIDERWVEK